MTNEMIQEAVLDRIDAIETEQLFAEYEVLMSLANVYAKSAMIQEAAEDLDFDGYNIIPIQEADEGTATKTKKGSEKLRKLKKKFIESRFIQWIIQAIHRIGIWLAKIGDNKKLSPKELAKLAANVDSLKVKGKEVKSDYDAGKIGNWSDQGSISSEKYTSFDGEIDAKMGNFSTGGVSVYDITVSGLKLPVDYEMLKESILLFKKAVDEYVLFVTDIDNFGGKRTASKVPPTLADCEKIIKLCGSALKVTEYNDVRFGELVNEYTDLRGDLDAVEKKLTEYTKKPNGSIEAVRLSDDVYEKLPDDDKEKVRNEIIRSEAAKELSKAVSYIVNNCSIISQAFNKLKSEDKYSEYLKDAIRQKAVKQVADKSAPKKYSMDAI